MKQIIKFRVSVEIHRNNWQISEPFDSYAEAQAWRLAKERELFKENPNRRGVTTNMLFERQTIEEGK